MFCALGGLEAAVTFLLAVNLASKRNQMGHTLAPATPYITVGGHCYNLWI